MYQAAHRSAAPISGPVRALHWRTSEGWAVRCGIDMYIHNHIYICIVLYKYNIRIHHVYVWLYILHIYIQYMDNINHNYMWGKRPGFRIHIILTPRNGESTSCRWNYWPIKTVAFFLGKISANWLSMISLIFRNMIGWRLRVGKFLCTCTFVLTDGSSYRVPIQGGIRMIHLASRWCPQL